MGQDSEYRMVPWAILLLRLTLAGVLLIHGAVRLADKAAAVPLTEGILAGDAARVVVGSSELFIGLLLVAGLFVRTALIPVVIYFATTLVRKLKAGEPLISANGSEAEEYLVLLCLTLILLICGSGRLSLQSRFETRK
ncbi:MAG TPA: DoxX family protein [Planctomycetota bacterium]|jgi:uncharacterized membrane protein YphA (DoxX/SURF4 family)|nr:DoxX family protein [Planctomycetota bacterium]OQC21259.1 MAG: hypothetical protein BWX69_00990 [Planctomycetes bacterium ADurb.Bin069]HNR99209.1 DoxX family protein [Planctomycetota bacterium]HNU25282.1 DoxX family protein [Planctomycetota bacterium]HOE31036.1 DoxX family protein [Planctomycetota bacterium]